MRYDFLLDTYESECIKVVSVWSEFADGICRSVPARAIPVDAACTSRWSISA